MYCCLSASWVVLLPEQICCPATHLVCGDFSVGLQSRLQEALQVVPRLRIHLYGDAINRYHDAAGRQRHVGRS